MCLRWRLNAGMPELDGGSSGRLTALSDEAHSYRVVGLGNRRLVLGLLHAEPDRCRGVVADGHFHGDGELVITNPNRAADAITSPLKETRGAEDWVKQLTFPVAAYVLYMSD